MPTRLDQWPVKPSKRNADIVKPYLDGSIWRFDLDDIRQMGWIDIIQSHERDRYRDERTRMEYTLKTFRSRFQLAVRSIKEPWTTRYTIDPDEGTMTFQYTGLRECRHGGCDVKAIHDNAGYCNRHGG